MPSSIKYTRKKINKIIREATVDYTGRIWRINGSVYANNRRDVYVKRSDGVVVIAQNTVAPPKYKTNVIIAYSVKLRKYEVKSVRDVGGSTDDYPIIPGHNDTHTFPALDTVFIKNQQILSGLTTPYVGVKVKVEPFDFKIEDTIYFCPGGILNFEGDIPTQAVWALIEVGDDKVLSYRLGDEVLSPNLLLRSNLPTIDTSKVAISAVKLYHGQTEIKYQKDKSDILDLRFVNIGLGAGGSSGSVESVTGDGVDNTDPTNPIINWPTPEDIGAVPAGSSLHESIARFDGTDGNITSSEVTIDDDGNMQFQRPGAHIGFDQDESDLATPDTGRRNIGFVDTGRMVTKDQDAVVEVYAFVSEVEAARNDANDYTDSAIDAAIEDTIANGETAKAPSQNAVFDALALKQDSLGYTAENSANKSTDVNADQASNTKYPSVKAVYDWAVGIFEKLANKDASGGYVGLTLFKINFKNAANTFTSFFTNANTAARTYTFQNRDGIIVDDTDLAGKQPLDSDLTAIAALAPTDDDIIQRKAGAWTNRTLLQYATDLPNGAMKIKNTSGATANANDVGYVNDAGEYKTTTTAEDVVAWCVVLVSGANNADIVVTRRGRVTVNYTGTAPSQGHFLSTSTSAGLAQRETAMHPSIFAVCTAAGSGGTVQVQLLCMTTFRPLTKSTDILRINAMASSDFVATINGAPTGTTLTYNAPSSGAENTIVPASASEVGNLVCFNTTRGTSALVDSVNTGTNVITFVTAPPTGSANGDTITFRSQTDSAALQAGIYKYEIDLTGVGLVNTRAIALSCQAHDTGTISGNTFAFVHKLSASVAFASGISWIADWAHIIIPAVDVINNKIMFAVGASGASSMNYFILRLNGVWEATP